MNKRIFLNTAAALLFAASSTLAADVRQGLVAYWPLDTAAGGGIPMTTPDVVGGNTMTGPGKDSTTALVAGKYGNAVTFAGSLSDYLFFTNAPGADTGLPVGKNGSWTYSLWVKGAAPQADQTCLFGEFSTTDSGGNPRYEMMMNGTGVNTNKNRIFMRSTGGTVLADAPTASDVYDSTWHHIAYTYDISATSNRFRVYVDGVANYTNSFSLNQGVASFNCISIGARVRTSVGLPFTGQVDDVALWSRALSQGEIQDVMTNSIATPVPAFAPVVTANPTGATNLLVGDSFTMSGAATGSRPFFYQRLKNGTNYPGANANSLALSSMTTNDSGQYRLVITNASGISVTSLVAQITVNAFASPNLTNGMLAYWPLDTIAGVKTPDLVSAYDMTLGGTVNPTLVPGKWGNALSFDETKSQIARVIYAPGSALPAYTRTNFTVSFWVKAPDAVQGWAFSEASTLNTGAAFVMGKHNNNKLYRFIRNDSGGTTTVTDSTTTGVWDDNWHNIVYVQHDAGGTPKASLYIDGVLDAATQNPIYGVTPNNTALGAYSRLAPNVFYTGLVDEVAIWGRPLSPAEITSIQSGYITNPPSLLLPLAITTFKSDLPAVAKGDSTVLRWDVPALTTQVLIDKLGDVTSKTVGGIGTTNLTLTNTTTYVLTVIRDTIALGHEVVKATNTIGVVDGVAANWHLLDNFDFYNPGSLAANGWWVDLGGYATDVVTPTNCNRLVKTLLSQGAAYLRLNNLTVLSNQSATLFFRMIPQGNSSIRQVVGITDKPANFYFQLESQVGPAVQPTVNDPTQNPGDWLLAARNVPYSALTFDTNVLATGAVYNVWIDVTNVFIGDRIYPDNYDMFSVYLQKEGDPGRTTLFTDFISDRDLLLSDPLTGGLPTENLTRIFLGANNATESALFDDFYLSKSGYNATIPRAYGYAGPAPTLQVIKSGGQWQVLFQGALQAAPTVTGTYTNVSGATSPYLVPTTGDKQFYRAVCY